MYYDDPNEMLGTNEGYFDDIVCFDEPTAEQEFQHIVEIAFEDRNAEPEENFPLPVRYTIASEEYGRTFTVLCTDGKYRTVRLHESYSPATREEPEDYDVWLEWGDT